MAADGFAWWRLRITRQRELFDLVRIDHFRGFEAAWHVPVEAPTARDGHGGSRLPGGRCWPRWSRPPGRGRWSPRTSASSPPRSTRCGLDFGLPGMKVLQFAFDGEVDNPYLPERHGEESVAYTGTHDNDTTVGWWAAEDEKTHELVRARVPVPDEPMPWALIRLAMSSTARLAVVPAQDLLGLGSASRMNTPGTDEGNWAWQRSTVTSTRRSQNGPGSWWRSLDD